VCRSWSTRPRRSTSRSRRCRARCGHRPRPLTLAASILTLAVVDSLDDAVDTNAEGRIVRSGLPLADVDRFLREEQVTSPCAAALTLAARNKRGGQADEQQQAGGDRGDGQRTWPSVDPCQLGQGGAARVVAEDDTLAHRHVLGWHHGVVDRRRRAPSQFTLYS